ncbi:PREDICTED: uncharacterized protein LOC104805620 isoform X2 [Tarenaya hassleriana]|uniref:uncharacterized protein LOC104805620 isoform X2 n=1 Tax=Tarenaya hassleriana TaxID=28532 RepID=UPI00053CA39F|nr:PREDICTED: uncharacterized protein LOC104805620 isoform X2 [Tarenaya hassleriana]
MFHSSMITQTMRNLKISLARFSNRSSITVSARFRNLVSRTVVECHHGRSYASSSVASQMASMSKVGTRLSRDERRALVVSFVTRYRATNGGKFPNLKATHKEVGGSYYIVRDIFQELKFESQTPSVSSAQDLSMEIVASENSDSSLAMNESDTDGHSRNPAHDVGGTDVVEAEANCVTGDVDVSDPGSDKSSDTSVIIAKVDELRNRGMETMPQNGVESKGDSIDHLPSDNSQSDVVSDACFENADPEKEPSLSENFKTCEGQKVDEETHTTSYPVSENPKDNTKTENSMHLGGQESKGDHIPLEAENMAREEALDGGAGEVKTKRQGSVWSNLKWMAEGIMSFWRKG